MRNIFLALVALAMGCSHGESPTDAGSLIHLSIIVRTTSSTALQKAKLVFDGRDVVTVESPAGSGQMLLEGTVSGAGRGMHTMRIVILQQASTPNSYSAGGSVSTADRILDLAPVEGIVATGQSLEFHITL
jgi:hypothetical protein